MVVSRQLILPGPTECLLLLYAPGNDRYALNRTLFSISKKKKDLQQISPQLWSSRDLLVILLVYYEY